MRPIVPVLRDAMRFSDLERDFARWLAVQECSEHTIKNYTTACGQFRGYAEGVKGHRDDARNLNDDMVRDFMVYLNERGVKANTIRARLSALSALARFAMRVRQGKTYVLDRDPTRAVDWPPQQKTETKFLLPAELRAFRAAPSTGGERIAVELFLETALRVNEIAQASVGDVVAAEDGYYLSVTVKSRRGRRERRHVPLSRKLADALRDYLLSRGNVNPTDPLIVRENGDRWDRRRLSDLMARLGVSAGIVRFRVSAHKLRHTSNVIAQAAAIDPFLRARLLNHSSTRTLDRYDHLLPMQLRAVRDIHQDGIERYGAYDEQNSIMPRNDSKDAGGADVTTRDIEEAE